MPIMLAPTLNQSKLRFRRIARMMQDTVEIMPVIPTMVIATRNHILPYSEGKDSPYLAESSERLVSNLKPVADINFWPLQETLRNGKASARMITRIVGEPMR
jgi:hypothetical protein